MAKSNVSLNLKKQQQQFQRYYDSYVRILQELLLSQFQYTNVPDTINIRFMEQQLIGNQGQVGFFVDDSVGLLVLPCVGRELGFYGEPLNFEAYQVTGYRRNIYFNVLDLERSDGVVMYDNQLHTNYTWQTIDLFARRLANLDIIIDNHIRLTNTVPLIMSQQSQLKQAQNMMAAFDQNTPAIYADMTFDPQTVKMLEFNKQYNGDKLNELKKDTWAEALKYCGIARDYVQNKTERTIVAEVRMANSESFEIAYTRLVERRKAIDLVNKMFGTNIEVDIREYYATSSLESSGVVPQLDAGGDINEAKQ